MTSVLARIAVATAAALAVSACTLTVAHPSLVVTATRQAIGVPVRVSAAPRSPSKTRLQTVPHSHVQTCSVIGADRAGAAPGRGEVGVDPDPLGAEAEWLPGLNQRPCHAQLTQLGQPLARRLAAAVDTGQPVKLGHGVAYNCALADLTAVDLYFRYPGHVVEMVSVDLAGCGWINAPARTSRFTPPTLRTELDTIAPPPWRS